MSNLLNLLHGATTDSQKALDELTTRLPEQPKMLWYPSAGFDLRDVLRFSVKHKTANLGVEELPDLFVHTDYMALSDERDFEPGVFYEDNRTQIEIQKSHQLYWKSPHSVSSNYEAEVDYYESLYGVSPFYYSAFKPFANYGSRGQRFRNRTSRISDFSVFPESLPHVPKVYLIDLVIESKTLGGFEANVLYVIMENFNFLCEILLRNKLKVSHLVKVRDGTTMGGNRCCGSTIYPFLGELETKYVIADDRFYPRKNVIKEIALEYDILPIEPTLNPIQMIEDWSGFEITSYRVDY